MYGIVNRRLLRIKVLQALYSFHHSNNDETLIENQILKSINEVYILFLYQIDLILEVFKMAEKSIEIKISKQLPSQEDLHPNKKFITNKAYQILENNKFIQDDLSKIKTNWSIESDNIKKLWIIISKSQEYINYMQKESFNFEDDKEFVINIYTQYIAIYEGLFHFLGDKSIYWLDDLPSVAKAVIRFIKQLKNIENPMLKITPELHLNKKEDMIFLKKLFKNTIIYNDYLNKIIGEKIEGWESDRIVHTDMLTMKMAIIEFLHMEDIPIKVTLNEYIELSKMYSTPNSKNFVNGVLDKIVANFKLQNKIKKNKRGLIE